MQTSSIGLKVQINFEFDTTKTTYKQAYKEALKLAFRPDFNTMVGDIRLTEMIIDDLEGAGTLKHIKASTERKNSKVK